MWKGFALSLQAPRSGVGCVKPLNSHNIENLKRLFKCKKDQIILYKKVEIIVFFFKIKTEKQLTKHK